MHVSQVWIYSLSSLFFGGVMEPLDGHSGCLSLFQISGSQALSTTKKNEMAINDCKFITTVEVWQEVRDVVLLLASRLGCVSSAELGQHWIERASCSFFHETWRNGCKRWQFQIHLRHNWCLSKGLHCQLSLLSGLSITLPLRYCTLMLQARARTNVYLEGVWESSQLAS